jgi:pyrroline-5-carboxylate reductase
MKYELGILGAGNMAEAIVRGVIKQGVLRAEQVAAADPSAQRRQMFSSELGIATAGENLDIAGKSRMLLLSVKPQQMATALAGLGSAIDPQTLIISIAAGVRSSFIEQQLGSGANWRVIRAMPNTPMLVGQGITGIARGAHATDDDLAAARQLFESAGSVIEVTEDQINAVTALSGSGPAYFFYLVEQMMQAATEMGLSAEHAKLLASKTAIGAAAMLATGQAPDELRKKVTSPGGTTQAAIELLQSRNAAQIIIDAIKAAQQRGKELGG